MATLPFQAILVSWTIASSNYTHECMRLVTVRLESVNCSTLQSYQPVLTHGGGCVYVWGRGCGVAEQWFSHRQQILQPELMVALEWVRVKWFG